MLQSITMKATTVFPPLPCAAFTICLVMRLARKEWIVFLLLFDDRPHHLHDNNDDDEKKRFECLTKSSQQNFESDDPNDFITNKGTTSMRQAAEWGMRSLQGSFPRLKDCFTFEQNCERELTMLSILCLCDSRAR